VVPEKVNGKTQADPVSGPEDVIQVEEAAVVLVTAVVVVLVVTVVVVSGEDVVVADVVVEVVPQMLLVQTGLLSDPQTHVLQSTV